MVNAENEDRRVFLHPSLVPLRQRPFEKDTNRISLYSEECTGGCFN